MSHYEVRLEKDLERIVSDVQSIGEAVEKGLLQASKSLLTCDHDLASSVILGDMPINRDVRALDKRCHVFVARHLPSAGHLRFVSSVLRLNIGIERSGDYAATIAREAVQLTNAPPSNIAAHIERLSDQSRRMFQQALVAFCQEDVDLAHATKEIRKDVEAGFQSAFADLVSDNLGGSSNRKERIAYLTVLNCFSRVAAQAKNVCEETIFRVTGETKAPKVYRVLFIDERNDGASQLAAACARKTFPNSGEYSSAGWQPGSTIDAAYSRIADEQSFDLGDTEPTALPGNLAQLSRYHVIVSLDADGRSKLVELPFQTTFLQWEPLDATTDEGRRELAHRIRELMEVLRGESAD